MNIIKLNLPKENRFSIEDPIIHSDTLFSAIVNCYVKLYGDEKVSDFIDKVKISSVFIGLKIENEEIYLLPKPQIEPSFLETADRDARKEWKKLKLLSKNIFEKVVSGDKNVKFKKWSGIAFTIEEYERLNIASMEKEKFENLSFINKYIEMKNALNRYTGASEQLFSKEVLEFQSIGNITPFLYFFIEGNDNEILASLRLMADEGLGGERSTGKGILSGIDKGNLDINIKFNKYISLSLAMPKDMGEAKKVESYNFIKRGGYAFYGMGTGQRKKRIRMFDIGSVFNDKIEGTNVESKITIDSTGEKTIFHYGKALLIGGANNG